MQYLQSLEGVVLEIFSVHKLTSCCSGKSSRTESMFGLKSNDITAEGRGKMQLKQI